MCIYIDLRRIGQGQNTTTSGTERPQSTLLRLRLFSRRRKSSSPVLRRVGSIGRWDTPPAIYFRVIVKVSRSLICTLAITTDPAFNSSVADSCRQFVRSRTEPEPNPSYTICKRKLTWPASSDRRGRPGPRPRSETPGSRPPSALEYRYRGSWLG